MTLGGTTRAASASPRGVTQQDHLVAWTTRLTSAAREEEEESCFREDRVQGFAARRGRDVSIFKTKGREGGIETRIAFRDIQLPCERARGSGRFLSGDR